MILVHRLMAQVYNTVETYLSDKRMRKRIAQ